MGIAAYNRGSMVFIRNIRAGDEERNLRVNLVRAIEAEESAHAWRREASLASADAIERGGMLASMLTKSDRVYEARKGAVNRTLIAWQDARDPFVRASAAVDWAAAVYRMLDWGRGMFRFPILDAAPATVRRRAKKAAKC